MMYAGTVDHFHRPTESTPPTHTVDVEAKRDDRPTSTNASTTIEEVAEDQTWEASTQDLLIMFTIAISSLMVALDATILVPVLPTLASELHGSTADAFWTGTAYLLSHAVFQPFIATLSDIFGRYELLTPSIILFAIGSIICAVARNFTCMLAGRVVQGLGGAGIITLSQLVFADLVPLQQRPKYFTIILGAWAVGSLLGPLIGGLLVEKASWRWCFYLNLPICIIALAMAGFLRRLEHVTKTTLRQKLQKMDLVGNLLFITSLTSFLVAISWAGVRFPWTSLITIFPLILGIVGLAGSICYERFLASHPFLHRALFNQPSTIASYTAAMLQGLILYMALYYTSFYFSSTHFFSPLHTGISILPATALLVPGSALVSALITRTARFRWAIYTGWLISAIASGLFVLLDEHTHTPIWATCLSLLGLGMGMVLSSVNFSVQAVVEPLHAGQAAAMYAFSRSVGMTAGVALGGSVFQNLMRRKLVQLGVEHAADVARDAEAYVQVLKRLSARQQAVVMHGYVLGFRGVWTVMTALCVAGLLVSLFIKRGNLDRVLESRFKTRTVG